jgi:hypothetical protein
MTSFPIEEKFGNIAQNLAENFDPTGQEFFFELVTFLFYIKLTNNLA